MVRSLRNQGRADGGGWLDHAYLGYNYRIDDIRAAIGVAQVEKLPRILELRSQVAARYDRLLAGIDGVELPWPDEVRERFGFAEGLCPVSEDASRRTLALPFATALPADDQEYVADALRAAIQRAH